MQADVVQDVRGETKARSLRLGPVGIVGVVFGLSTPLTLGFGLLVSLLMATALACMRRWLAVGLVIGAAAVGFAVWMLLATPADVDSDAEVGCPDGRTIQITETEFKAMTPQKLESICKVD